MAKGGSKKGVDKWRGQREVKGRPKGGKIGRTKAEAKGEDKTRPKGEAKGEVQRVRPKGKPKEGQSGRPNGAKLSHPLVLHATMRWRNRLQAKRIKQLSQRGPLSNPQPDAT